MYVIGQKLQKRDKLGLHATIEKISVELLLLGIDAALKSKKLKLPSLERLRGLTNVLQNLIRTENELAIIDEKTYLRLSKQLTEIGKMTSGWIIYTHKESV